MPRGHYPHPRKPLAVRFWAKVEKSADCWTWRGASDPTGYGQIAIVDPVTRRYRPHKAHRIAWELTNGPIPPGLFACHRCDNPGCVNPSHLFLGDARANSHDMSAKHRQAGMSNTHCKQGHELTPENTYKRGLNGRGCVECKRRVGREHMRKRRSAERHAA